jgi:hypothetical protein
MLSGLLMLLICFIYGVAGPAYDEYRADRRRARHY